MDKPLPKDKWEVGGWRMANPHLVVKLGFVVDAYKVPKLSKLWIAAEEEAAVRLGRFNPKDLFHQEEHALPDQLVASYRWYTPESNRKRIDVNEGKL